MPGAAAKRRSIPRCPPSATDSTTRRARSFFATLECELFDRNSFRNQVGARLAVLLVVDGLQELRRRQSATRGISPSCFEVRRAPSASAAEPGPRSRARENQGMTEPLRDATTSPQPVISVKAANCPANRGSSARPVEPATLRESGSSNHACAPGSPRPPLKSQVARPGASRWRGIALLLSRLMGRRWTAEAKAQTEEEECSIRLFPQSSALEILSDDLTDVVSAIEALGLADCGAN